MEPDIDINNVIIDIKLFNEINFPTHIPNSNMSVLININFNIFYWIL